MTATTAMTSAQVATAFASRADGVSGNNISPYSDGTSSGTFAGSLNGWSSGTVSGSVVRFTATPTGNVTDLGYSSATGQPDVVKVEPSGSVNEVSSVTFKPLAAGSSVTVAGLTYTASSAMTAAQVAAVFASKSDGYVGTGQYSGTLSGWASGTVSGSTINFTSTASGNVTDISQSAAVVQPTVTPTTTGQAGTAQTSQVTFNALSSGGSVTIGGLTFTANASLTSAQVAAAFASLSAGVTTGPGTANGTYSGTLSGWSSGTISGSNITFTATTLGPVNDLTISATNSSEINDVTFKDLAAGRSVTVGGLTFTASTNMLAAQVATAFASRADGVSGTNLSPYSDGTNSGVFSGSLNGWSSGAVSGAVVRFTSTVPGNVTDLTYATGTAQPDVAKVDGTTGNTEVAGITFKPLAIGSSVTIAGLTYTATAALTSAQVASAYASLAAGAITGSGTANGTYSGTLTGWSSGAVSGSVVNFTSTTAGSVADIALTAAVVAPTIATTVGVTGSPETNAFTFPTLALGDSITVGGLKFTLTGTIAGSSVATGAQVAAVFSNRENGFQGNGAYDDGVVLGALSGTLSGWSTGDNLSSAAVTFSSATGNNVTNLTYAKETSQLTLTRNPNTSAYEAASVTFPPLPSGGSVTVGGLTFTAGVAALTSVQVANAYEGLVDGSTTGPATGFGTYSGTLTGWSTGSEPLRDCRRLQLPNRMEL